MDENTMLTALKTDLQISSSGYDVRLRQYLQSAEVRIRRMGIALDTANSLDDAQLIVAFAAWQWRHRATGDAMPMMLRRDLADRVISGITEAGDG